MLKLEQKFGINKGKPERNIREESKERNESRQKCAPNSTED